MKLFIKIMANIVLLGSMIFIGSQTSEGVALAILLVVASYDLLQYIRKEEI